MAAELVAFYEASNHGLWLRIFVTGTTKVILDNKSALLYSNNNRSLSRSRHIDIKFLVVKEIMQSGQIFIEHVGTLYNCGSTY